MNEKMESVIRKLKMQGIEAEITSTPKNNEVLSGINIKSVNGEELHVRPVIYVDDWDEEPEDKIVEKVAHYMEIPAYREYNADRMIEMVSDYEKASENIVPAIVQTEGNEPLLSGIVSRKIPNTDLSVYFKVVDPTDHCSSIKISKGILDGWGISEDELYDTAIGNIDSVMDPLFAAMSSVLTGMLMNKNGGELPEDAPDLLGVDEKLFLIYSKKMECGSAAAILNNTLMDEIYREHGHYYILPSSLHEVIIVPSEKDETVEQELVEMVRCVNATEVSLQDKLSDSLYEWEPETGLLKVA